MDTKLLTEKTRFYQENRFLIMMLALLGVILFHPLINKISISFQKGVCLRKINVFLSNNLNLFLLTRITKKLN